MTNEQLAKKWKKTRTWETCHNRRIKRISIEVFERGKKAYAVTNWKNVDKLSDIYAKTTEYSKNGLTAWIPEGFAVEVSSTIDEISEGLVITDEIDVTENIRDQWHRRSSL